MGVSAADAERLTYPEYLSLLEAWNDAHSSDEDAVEPPAAEFMRERRAKLAGSSFGRVH